MAADNTGAIFFMKREFNLPNKLKFLIQVLIKLSTKFFKSYHCQKLTLSETIFAYSSNCALAYTRETFIIISKSEAYSDPCIISKMKCFCEKRLRDYLPVN